MESVHSKISGSASSRTRGWQRLGWVGLGLLRKGRFLSVCVCASVIFLHL